MTLRHGDLRNLVDDIIEIDSYQSKMGADEDVTTISISVKNKPAADDLMSFVEKGYDFVLDAEVTSGEQADGMYRVFIEIDRSRRIADEIMTVMDGVKKLADLDDFKFRYYKSFRSVPLTQEELEDIVPKTAEEYQEVKTAAHMDNYTNFFNKSFVESVKMNGDRLVIQKKWADPLDMKFVDFGDSSTVYANMTESFNFNDYPEILFMTKYIGDYNISKYGDYITLENDGKTLVVQRDLV